MKTGPVFVCPTIVDFLKRETVIDYPSSADSQRRWLAGQHHTANDIPGMCNVPRHNNALLVTANSCFIIPEQTMHRDPVLRSTFEWWLEAPRAYTMIHLARHSYAGLSSRLLPVISRRIGSPLNTKDIDASQHKAIDTGRRWRQSGQGDVYRGDDSRWLHSSRGRKFNPVRRSYLAHWSNRGTPRHWRNKHPLGAQDRTITIGYTTLTPQRSVH